MTDRNDDGAPPPRRPSAGEGGAGGAGFKFNQVGREEPAKLVLVPRVDPAVRRRTFLFVGLVVVAFVLLIFLIANPFGYRRTGGGAPAGDGEFRPPPPSFEGGR